jgi:hypothetical protein
MYRRLLPTVMFDSLYVGLFSTKYVQHEPKYPPQAWPLLFLAMTARAAPPLHRSPTHGTEELGTYLVVEMCVERPIYNGWIIRLVVSKSSVHNCDSSLVREVGTYLVVEMCVGKEWPVCIVVHRTLLYHGPSPLYIDSYSRVHAELFDIPLVRRPLLPTTRYVPSSSIL